MKQAVVSIYDHTLPFTKETGVTDETTVVTLSEDRWSVACFQSPFWKKKNFYHIVEKEDYAVIENENNVTKPCLIPSKIIFSDC